MIDNLTIVLPLKGRPEFTDRFLSHVCRWDCQVLVADGSLSPQRDRVQGYGVQYHCHEPDHTLADYWAKMVWALEMVTTPYAMVCDNDDFPLRGGLARCVEFLESHPDFVCASGRIRGFWLFPEKTFGPISYITRQYAPYDTPAVYGEDDVSDRVLAGFRNSWSYYAVYRTEALRQVWKGVHSLGLKDLMVHEKYCAMETLLQGKAVCFPGFASYLRQYETTLRNTDIEADWAARFAKGEWMTDVQMVLAVMGAHGVDKQALSHAWADWYADHMNYHFGWRGRLRRKLKRGFPGLAYAFQHRHRIYPQRPNIHRILENDSLA